MTRKYTDPWFEVHIVDGDDMEVCLNTVEQAKEYVSERMEEDLVNEDPTDYYIVECRRIMIVSPETTVTPVFKEI